MSDFDDLEFYGGGYGEYTITIKEPINSSLRRRVPVHKHIVPVSEVSNYKEFQCPLINNGNTH